MLKPVTPPAEPVVSLAEAKNHLRVFHDDDDDYISALVSVAIGMVDGTDGFLGRALKEQVWQYNLDRFPCSDEKGKSTRLFVPLAPLMSIVSVEYTDTGGDVQPLSGFRTFGIGSTQPGYIMPAIDHSWPSTICEPESVRIVFTAGYDDVPAGIQHAILLMVGNWYEYREDVADGSIVEMPFASKALLMPHRNWRG